MPKPQDEEGQELTVRIDTITPVLSELSIVSSNAGAETDIDRPDHLLAMQGDEFTLFFQTSERVLGRDETSSKQGLKPEVEFISFLETGDKLRFPATVSKDTSTSGSMKDESVHKGLHWKAVFEVDNSTHPDLSDLESDLGFVITVRDPSGNERELGFDNSSVSSDTAQPTTAPAKMARVDLKAPVLSGLSLATTNLGITDTDRSDVLFATTGDTLTLSFTTNERIATPDDGALAPEVEIHDEEGNKIGTGNVSVQSSDAGSGELWKAEFTVPTPDNISFKDLETDLGFEIRVKDPSGNERILGFDHEGNLVDPTGTQTTQAPSNGARIDTKAPAVTLVSLETSNAGLSDQDLPSHLLAREGDNLTLYFTTRERIAGVDESIIVSGALSSNGIPGSEAANGKYASTGNLVNGKSSYMNDNSWELYFNGTDAWCIRGTEPPTPAVYVQVASGSTPPEGLWHYNRDTITLTNPLKPIVEFKAGSDKVFDAIVSRDTVATDSQNEESHHKGLHWKAVINIDPTTDTNFSELESDLGFKVKIL
ncbi:MAG: hypothetical protein QF691_11665, partial [SAR324 cluster bacterium]|nr:hypothetical protein [SAR324 cluster bacterium]